MNASRSALLVHSLVGLALGASLAAMGLSRGAMGVVVLGAVVSVVYWLVMLPSRLRVLRAEQAPVTEATREALRARIPFYRALPADEQPPFERRVTRLLHALEFEAVPGADDDHELRVMAVAGVACLLHGRPDIRVPLTRTVIFYPDAFDEDYGVDAAAKIAGMVHRQGPIIFSSRSLRRGWNATSDGHNVSVHEWAHVLDLDDGFADGLPGLTPPGKGAKTDWNALVEEELRRVHAGRSALRDYAGTNRAELFAVAAEVFIERPKVLRKKHPELYLAMTEALMRDPLAK